MKVINMATYRRRSVDIYSRDAHKTVCDAFKDDFDARAWWRAVATFWALLACVVGIVAVVRWVL